MTFPTEITIQPDEHREGETMHLLDATAKKELALCVAEISVFNLTSVQYFLLQRMDGISVRNVCRTCMGFAACWDEGHYSKLEADAMLLRAKRHRLHISPVHVSNRRSIQASSADSRESPRNLPRLLSQARLTCLRSPGAALPTSTRSGYEVLRIGLLADLFPSTGE